MGETFKKLHKRFLVGAIVKSLVVGISCGLLVVGILLLSLKLNEIDINAGFYVLTGFGVSAFVGVSLFFILRSTKVKTAKKLDGEYSLGEKVQTMVAYAGESGEMYELQRADADKVLSELPPQKIKFSRIWHYILIGVLSVAMFFTAVFVPIPKDEAEEETPPPTVEEPPTVDDEKFEYSIELQRAMAELIRNVRESVYYIDTVKTASVTALESLDAKLKTVSWKSEMKAAVLSTVVFINGVTQEVNTYRRISDKILPFDENLPAALSDGIVVYKSGGSLTTIDRVESLRRTSLGDAIENALLNHLENLKQSLRVPDEEGVAELKLLLESYVAKLNTALTESGVNEEDLLYSTFTDFSSALYSTANMAVSGYGKPRLYEQITAAVADLKNGIVDALLDQSFNCMMCVFIRINLANMFGVSDLPSIPEDESSGGNQGGDNSDVNQKPEGGNHGGFGNGDELYGSDDLIYNPDTGEYVKYGELLDEYYAKVLDHIMNEDLPDDLRKSIENYFGILFNGMKDPADGSENN